MTTAVAFIEGTGALAFFALVGFVFSVALAVFCVWLVCEALYRAVLGGRP